MMTCMYVGISLLAAAAAGADLVEWGYEEYLAQQAQPTPPHIECHSVPASCPPATKDPQRRQKLSTTNIVRVSTGIVRARVFEMHVWIFSLNVHVRGSS